MDWNFLIVGAAIVSAIIAIISNQRSKKLFDAQNQPKLQCKPMNFLKGHPVPSAGTTILEIHNYGMADAYEVDWDLKRGGNWIKEWIKAKMADLATKGNNRTSSEETEFNAYRPMIFKMENLQSEVSFRVPISGTIPTDLKEQAKSGNGYTFQVKIN